MKQRNNNDNPGCLSGILQIFLLSKVYNWGQEKFGAKRGGCCGCLIGTIMFVIFIILILQIVFNVDWLNFSF